MKVLSIYDIDEAVRAADGGVTSSQQRVELNGPPGALTGSLEIENTSDDLVFVETLQARVSKGKSPKGAQKLSALPAAIQIQQSLAAGEARTARLSVALPPDTSPGAYVFDIAVGSSVVSAQATVQPVLDVELVPSTLFFLGTEPKTVHEASVLFANHGNVPLVVPSLRHSTALDMDLICRNLSRAVRDKGDEGAEATFDEFFKLTKAEMAGWVTLSVDEAGTVVPPGGAVTMHITFTMPDDVPKSNVVHDGDVRIYDELLSYIIAPSP